MNGQSFGHHIFLVHILNTIRNHVMVKYCHQYTEVYAETALNTLRFLRLNRQRCFIRFSFLFAATTLYLNLERHSDAEEFFQLNISTSGAEGSTVSFSLTVPISFSLVIMIYYNLQFLFAA